MRLTIVRHARALDKSSWTEHDLRRPLESFGERQAKALSVEIAEHTVRRIVSSPAVRCQQSVQPLADAVGLPIELWDELGPDGLGTTIVTECFANAAYDDAVICTHGELMQPLTHLEDLRRAARRRDLSSQRLLRKGSAWRLRIDTSGRITKLDHIVPNEF